MPNLLEKLQNKPRPVRVAIMWAAVIICMAIVLRLWTWSLKENTSSITNQDTTLKHEQENGASTELKQTVPSLWQSLKATVGDVVQEGVEALKKEEAKNQTETPVIEKKIEFLPTATDQIPSSSLPAAEDIGQ